MSDRTTSHSTAPLSLSSEGGCSVLPGVDIVVVTYNSARYIETLFESLRTLDYPANQLRLIVVDNASSDETRELVRERARSLAFPTKVIESSVNEGFGAGCNRGAAVGSAPFTLFLNPDTSAEPHMLRRMVARAVSELSVGVVDAAQEPVDIMKYYDHESGDTDWCSGGAVLARREAFVSVGGFDPFFFLYCEDVDLSWRLWLRGWRCVHEPDARVWHETMTSQRDVKPRAMYYSIRNSFAMRLIYDSWRGAASHFVRGLRYLVSPSCDRLTRRAVISGLWRNTRALPHLLNRRRAAQAALAVSPERDRFVFTEWFYGRFIR